MLRRGVLVKDTHKSTVRLAPPLVISEEELGWMISQFSDIIAAATATVH
jgi:ornithine--oxo-acid transaminase